MINEAQARKILQDGLQQDVQPIINKMAELISDAYQAGFNAGFKVAHIQDTKNWLGNT